MHIKQGDKQCLLAAICQLYPKGQDIFDRLRMNYDYTNRDATIKYVAPWVLPQVTNLMLGGTTQDITRKTIPRTGSGILIIRYPNLTMYHAVSYTSGKLLDPQGHGQFETFAEYQYRVNPDAEIIAIIPKPKGEK